MRKYPQKWKKERGGYAGNVDIPRPTIIETDTQDVPVEQSHAISSSQIVSEILAVIECELDFHREHITPLDVQEYLNGKNQRTPQQLVINELNFLKRYILQDLELNEGGKNEGR